MGAYLNSDGLYIKTGTTSATATTAGDFRSLGETRVIELDINLVGLTATPAIQADTTFIPAGVVIESVEVVTVTAATTGTSLSVGLIGLDRTTVASNTGFVAALVTASMNVVGEKTILTGGVTSAGAYAITPTPSNGYITAIADGTYDAGKVKVRIKYRGVPPITQ